MGDVPLDSVQAGHARNALRLEDGSEVEVFDDQGMVGIGKLVFVDAYQTLVRVAQIKVQNDGSTFRLTIAAAVPKGERADWMIEKLSELGVHEFIPLDTARGVVKPEGKSKYERWLRIATESAKQSRRTGVMRIGQLKGISALIQEVGSEQNIKSFYLSTDPGAVPLAQQVKEKLSSLLLLVGPEGGWTDEEIRLFESHRIEGAKLTPTILRIETAAIAGAAVVLS
jgi:16S rRNA (uracil1498-N3)-methyltransferase